MEILRSLFSCFTPFSQFNSYSFRRSDATYSGHNRENYQKNLSSYEKLKKDDDFEEKPNPSLIEAVDKYKIYDMDSMPLNEVKLIASEIFEIFKPNLEAESMTKHGKLESQLIHCHLSRQNLSFRFAMTEILNAYWDDIKAQKKPLTETALLTMGLTCTNTEFKNFKKELRKTEEYRYYY